MHRPGRRRACSRSARLPSQVGRPRLQSPAQWVIDPGGEAREGEGTPDVITHEGVVGCGCRDGARGRGRGAGARAVQQQHGEEAHQGRDGRRRARASRGVPGDRRRVRRPRRRAGPATRASVDYVVEQLEAAGYSPDRAGVRLRLLRGELKLHPELAAARGRSSTGPTSCATRSTRARPRAPRPARCVPVDLVLNPAGPANSSSSGCEAADFAGFPAGSIALVQRGTCGFNVKVLNAQAAGAAAVVVMNEGQPGRTGLVSMIGDATGLTHPGGVRDLRRGLRTSPRRRRDRHRHGRLRRGDARRVQRDRRDRHRQRRQRRHGGRAPRLRPGRRGHQRQRLGQRRAAGDRDPDGQGQAGQHRALRLVGRRGGGSARLGVLRLPAVGGGDRRHRALPQLRHGRLAELHVRRLRRRRLGRHGGPGFIPEGSAEIEDVFEAFYASRGEPFQDTEFSGRSDYGPFIAVDIPAGGLFTGAEGRKTAEEAELFGGAAGRCYDPCYHQFCDNLTGERARTRRCTPCCARTTSSSATSTSTRWT